MKDETVFVLVICSVLFLGLIASTMYVFLKQWWFQKPRKSEQSAQTYDVRMINLRIITFDDEYIDVVITGRISVNQVEGERQIIVEDAVEVFQRWRLGNMLRISAERWISMSNVKDLIISGISEYNVHIGE